MSTDFNDPLAFKTVKWKHSDGTVHYGDVETVDLDRNGELERLKAQGKAIVSDSIYPERFIVERSKLEVVEIDDFIAMIDAESEKAYAQNEKNDFKVAVGTVFSVGVGDGGAHYVITKVNKKTCKIEWRGYGYDRYIDRFLGWGGTFPINRIDPLIVKGNLARRLRRFHK
jgi:hypothetical protein